MVWGNFKDSEYGINPSSMWNFLWFMTSTREFVWGNYFRGCNFTFSVILVLPPGPTPSFQQTSSDTNISSNIAVGDKAFLKYCNKELLAFVLCLHWIVWLKHVLLSFSVLSSFPKTDKSKSLEFQSLHLLNN